MLRLESSEVDTMPSIRHPMSRDRDIWGEVTMSKRSVIPIIKVLRTDTRQRILYAVANGSDTTRRLAEELSLPVSTVRSNVTCLVDNGLLVARRTGATYVYVLAPRTRFVTRGRNAILEVTASDGGRMELSRPAAWYRDSRDGGKQGSVT